MFSIGEFSKVTGLPIKTLRFYHEEGLLEPTHVEPGSGYRFYAEDKVETARVIAALRDLEFSLAEISQMLSECEDEANVIRFLEARKQEIQQRMRNDRRIVRILDDILKREKEASQTMSQSNYAVEEKAVETLLVASIRMRGKYSECGSGFSRIGRAFGRHICGKAMLLCHDSEYKPDDADFEVAMPIRKGAPTDEIDVRELTGGRCLSLMHRGPYDELSRSYKRLFAYANEHELKYSAPCREVYHKGPGMIFRGNPKNYLTEIQLMIEA